MYDLYLQLVNIEIESTATRRSLDETTEANDQLQVNTFFVIRLVTLKFILMMGKQNKSSINIS